jgi:hypothetical protein
MPTSASSTYSAHRLDPLFEGKEARQIAVNISASQTIARGTTLGEVSASLGTYQAFASGASDGTQNPKGIIEYDITTDSSGNITSLGDFGLTTKTVPMWVSGYFNIADLYDDGSAGIKATTVTALGGVVIEGAASSGRYTAGILKL